MTLLALGPLLPGGLDLERAEHRLLVAGLAAIAAVGAGGRRRPDRGAAARAVLVKNLVGSVAKLAALAALAAAGVFGMLGLGHLVQRRAGLAAAMGARPCGGGCRRTGRRPARSGAAAYLSFSCRSYAGTVIGILPATVVPLMVLAAAGPVATAYFARRLHAGELPRLHALHDGAVAHGRGQPGRADPPGRRRQGAPPHLRAAAAGVCCWPWPPPSCCACSGMTTRRARRPACSSWRSARWRPDAPTWSNFDPGGPRPHARLRPDERGQRGLGAGARGRDAALRARRRGAA